LADHTIHISLQNGQFQYQLQSAGNGASQDGTHVHVKKNHTIRWRCDAGHFAVLFKRSALDTDSLSAASGQHTVEAKVKAGPDGNNVYPYFVIVMADGVPVFEDPTIIIDT
jgi:hypothetical protein